MRKTAAAVGIAAACIMAPASSALADSHDTGHHSQTVAAQPSPSPGQGGQGGGGMGGLWGLLGLAGLFGLIPRKGRGQQPSEYVSSGAGRGEHRNQGGRDRGDLP